MPADVARRSRIGAVVDVCVAVGRAGHRRAERAAAGVGRGLVVTHRNAEPERRVELEVPGATGSILRRRRWRIGRQRQLVGLRIARSGRVRIEQQRRLVVADIRALVVVRLIGLRTERAVVITVEKRLPQAALGGGRQGKKHQSATKHQAQKQDSSHLDDPPVVLSARGERHALSESAAGRAVEPSGLARVPADHPGRTPAPCSRSEAAGAPIRDRTTRSEDRSFPLSCCLYRSRGRTNLSCPRRPPVQTPVCRAGSCGTRRAAVAVHRESARRDGPGRDRTCDLGIKSPLLYQLSYRPAAGRA